jgi:hypothetical protein
MTRSFFWQMLIVLATVLFFNYVLNFRRRNIVLTY